MIQIEPLSKIVSVLGEGPLWQPQSSSIIWTDIPNNVLHIAELDSDKTRSLNTPTLVSAVVETKSGSLLVATKGGIAEIYPDDNFEILDEFLDSGMRMNDGKVDPRGKFWVGSLSTNFEANRGSLYEFGIGVERKIIAQDMTLSNGMGWSPDFKYFYYIESIPGILFRYNYDFTTGCISNKCILAEFDSTLGIPDGMCVTKDGQIVIAMWDGHRLELLGSNGKKIEEFKLPISRPTSCCFAGSDYSTLVVTTASQDIDRNLEPLAGMVLTLKGLGLTGLPSFKYGQEY